MKTFNLFVMSMMVMWASVYAEARRPFPSNKKRVSIILDEHYRGNNIIRLKQEIKNQNPGMNLRAMKLLSVTLMAKSRQGHGQADLMIAGSSADSARIYGNPGDFQSSHPQTFDRVILENRSYSSEGTWQIELQGNIKVKRIMITMESDIYGGPHQPPRGQVEIMNLGEETADKIVGSVKTFYIRERVQSIELVGTKRSLEIQSVEVEYGNGQIEYLYELQGGLSSGRMKIANIGGRRVVSVRVKSQTLNPFGSRGKFRVNAHVYR